MPVVPPSARMLMLVMLLGALASWLANCTPAAQPAPAIDRPPVPTLMATDVPATGARHADDADSGWQSPGPGVELRMLQVTRPQPLATAQLVIVRLDPSRVRFRIGYAPGHPQSLHSWFVQQHVVLAVNGGYFDAQYHSTALVISDGVASGTSYHGFGGMFAVAADGAVLLRSLRAQAYSPQEQLTQAMQSAPMLVMPGATVAAIHDDGQLARRTVIARDRSGRVLLIISPGIDFSLSALAAWLVSSDLAIDQALNLDGGSSTGLELQAGSLHEQIDPPGQLPLVLLVDARQ